MDERRRRLMALEQPPYGRRFEPITIAARECELRFQAPPAPELGPAVAGRVLLRRGANVVVPRPAVAIAVRAMRRGEHGAQCGEVAARADLQPFHQQIRLAARHAVPDRLPGAGAPPPCPPPPATPCPIGSGARAPAHRSARSPSASAANASA